MFIAWHHIQHQEGNPKSVIKGSDMIVLSCILKSVFFYQRVTTFLWATLFLMKNKH